jgi:hypothetical protein
MFVQLRNVTFGPSLLSIAGNVEYVLHVYCSLSFKLVLSEIE